MIIKKSTVRIRPTVDFLFFYAVFDNLYLQILDYEYIPFALI